VHKQFRKTLFGFKPAEVTEEIQWIDSEYQNKVSSLQEAIEKAKIDFNNSEEKLGELQDELDKYIVKEREIASVLVTAQINAQRIEEEAREKSRVILESAEKALRKKQEEIESLRLKLQRFKEEFKDMLDDYRLSIETMKEPDDKTSFVPMLVGNERDSNRAKKQDISS